MSDLDLLLEEIDILRQQIGSTIYRAKVTGNIEALEQIETALNNAVNDMPDLPLLGNIP
jgi:hypothetical protein